MHPILGLSVASMIFFGISIAAVPATHDSNAGVQITHRHDDNDEVDGRILLCTDYDFAGECEDYGFFEDGCSDFPWGLEGDISSVSPDPGFICTLYIDENCSTVGGILEVQYPGVSELTYGNDEFSSLSCFRINE